MSAGGLLLLLPLLLEGPAEPFWGEPPPALGGTTLVPSGSCTEARTGA
jgi:hypothetical protein